MIKIKLGGKHVQVIKWVFRLRPLRKPPSPNRNSSPITIISRLVRRLGQGSNEVSFPNLELPGYVQLEQEHGPIKPPKGCLPVYVGESEGEKQRVMVPVTHLNHPLIGKLLEEAEKDYGFAHPGGLSIPCAISEFEKVLETIATTQRKILILELSTLASKFNM